MWVISSCYWVKIEYRLGYFASAVEFPTVLSQLAHDDDRVPVANVTQTAPGEIIAESSTSNIVSNRRHFLPSAVNMRRGSLE